MKTKIGMIGAGHMGEALIVALYKKYTLFVCEKSPQRRKFLSKKYKILFKSSECLATCCDVIIFATKPQDIDSALIPYKNLKKKILIISIAAGIPTRYIEKHMNTNVRVVRAMPNLPLKIQQGITALCKGRYASAGDLKLSCAIFSCLGKSVVVQEKLMDAITAISGSGPGYIYLFAEQLMRAAQSLNIPPSLAKELVVETFFGSSCLLRQSQQDPSVLRAQVTSKGGTTQAAMDVFLSKKIDLIFKQATAAAARRAKELSRR